METVKYLNATVYAKLAPSPIHGVGVFAIRDIPKDTIITDYSIFTINNAGFLMLEEEHFALLDQDVRELILSHSLFREGQKKLYFYSPNMEVCLTSFMNHAEDANSDGRTSLRDIKKGEEITEDYSKLFAGKNPHPFTKNHLPFLKVTEDVVE